MSNVLQILTNNYSGETAFIIVDTTFGERIVYEDVVLPYNITDDVYEGNYEVYIPSYNLSYKFTYPEPYAPKDTEKCYCYKFTNTSLTKRRASLTLVNCNGVTEKLRINGGSFLYKCTYFNQYTADTFVNVESVVTFNVPTFSVVEFIVLILKTEFNAIFQFKDESVVFTEPNLPVLS